jgi:hypothetical protein
MNPLFSHHNPQLQNMSNAYQLLTSPNPMTLFNRLASNNPNLQPIVNMISKGVSPQQIFNNLCQQKGINPQEFLKQITKG